MAGPSSSVGLLGDRGAGTVSFFLAFFISLFLSFLDVFVYFFLFVLSFFPLICFFFFLGGGGRLRVQIGVGEARGPAPMRSPAL